VEPLAVCHGTPSGAKWNQQGRFVLGTVATDDQGLLVVGGHGESRGILRIMTVGTTMCRTVQSMPL